MDEHRSFRPPSLVTFDIFGTVLDWRSGLETACRGVGRPLRHGEFDRVVDLQAALERGLFLDYATITRASLSAALSLPDDDAALIADAIGDWPLYEDAPVLRSLMTIAPCAAMTNSDRVHGVAIQSRLGFRLDDWLCAEETRVYKPDPAFWRVMAGRRGVAPGPDWWHVSAYADYDLDAASALGLTTVFVRRPHAREGRATHAVADLDGLDRLLRRAASEPAPDGARADDPGSRPAP